ncbi:ubiquitin fusion degradation protein ufd1 protein [Acanthamoeba castellanii str. Neff]|uniref:Ubiquitin fusion degradation protein ufd1 protein n=1 Tax=Acanthamoeba castellanii (strain ATCC 30010 / Neff) TaxID=1257118 RepID=L8HFW5_ACACF|nr:ubiquitin fusion degradation protein ufd1 protein [Acanthamoeba castellanii str. Neff]ELR24040.1 ubiquitin fusion degradation protein ufd1 protein [Acanthamoeba castellanii str. Neff]
MKRTTAIRRWHGGLYAAHPPSFANRPDIEYGNKIILGSEVLGRLGGLVEEASPLLFQVASFSSPMLTAFAGVADFTAPHSSVVVLPRWMMDSLELKDGDEVRINLAAPPLPQGTFVRLRPSDGAWGALENPKAVLEEHLSYHYCSLTQGTDVWIRWQDVVHRLHVEECQPAESIQIVEVRLEVDLLPAPHSGREADRVCDLQLDSPHEATVEANHYTHFRFAPPDSLDRMDLRVVVEGIEGDPDVYASLVSKQPTLADHEWMAADTGSVQLTIPPSSDNGRRGVVYVGVNGYKAPARFRITITAHPHQEPSGLPDETAASEAKRCSNCFERHEAFCQRANYRCTVPGCGQVMPLGEMAKHADLRHSPLACMCGAELALDDLRTHKRRECPQR